MEPSKVFYTDFRTSAFGESLPAKLKRLARKAGFTNAHGIAAEYTGPTLFHFMIREAISITVSFLRGNL
jgi:hypothetical protein